MSGKKETPRQKMIGMMYLVLLALLALNVSKEVIAAFVTINDKIEGSNRIVQIKSNEIYSQFDQKKAVLIASKSELTEFDLWHSKAMKVKKLSIELVDYILHESNEMIKMSEGKDWIDTSSQDNKTIALKSLINIKHKDNYDIPTRFFVGSDPKKPNQRGLLISSKIHEYRDSICSILGTYQYNGKSYIFNSPKQLINLETALNSVLPVDQSIIKRLYQALSIPDELNSYSKDRSKLPWISAMFNRAPIVAAASIINAIKLDIKNSEAEAVEFLLNKVNAPIFSFNKIEPLPFATTSYINAGDSLNINVMIAAYDSTANRVIKYGIDSDTIESNWQETKGNIAVTGGVGHHKIKGVIGINEKGTLKWKPWSFNYSVGAPVGVIAQPEMRILYKGYNNIIEGTASGFSSENIRLTGSGCTLRKVSGQKYEAYPIKGKRKASINISAIKVDGNRVNLGTFEYIIKPMPTPQIYLGGIKNGDKPSHPAVGVQQRVSLRFGPEVMLRQVHFNILGGSVQVEGIKRVGKIKRDGRLDDNALQILKQSRAKTVTIQIQYRDPSDETRYATPLVFKSR